ncbi:MAG: YifB family Mg chelatase-like AAA ATPase [Holosporales bacterium]
MVARTHTVAFQGLDALTVEVQVQISSGLPAFQIVGLADKAVTESRERVRAALHAIGLALPAKRILVNLSPADLAKEGSHYDLPIALALLAALEVIPSGEMGQALALGELALDGTIRTVSGVLPAAIHASSQNLMLICPESCGPEAAWADDVPIIAPGSLLALINHFKGTQVLGRPSPRVGEHDVQNLDLKDVRGQESAKRALEIAAAGGHNLLMSGPPGSGKSMLAARLISILPSLEAEEALDVTMIHSIAGLLQEGQLIRTRPYRDPHHSASLAALVGGGHKALPGEVTLAHKGVLFLDELPEFSRSTLEALRQPLESGKVTVARANAHVTYPAEFQLIAAMNPCRCGYLDDATRSCSKAPKCGQDYQTRLSGPLLDRIDFHVFVPAVPAPSLTKIPQGESSTSVRQRVERARQQQRQRCLELGLKPHLNTHLKDEALDTVIDLSSECQNLMQQAVDRFRLSARAYHRVLRVARTVADLEASKALAPQHIAEALAFRNLPMAA